MNTEISAIILGHVGTQEMLKPLVIADTIMKLEMKGIYGNPQVSCQKLLDMAMEDNEQDDQHREKPGGIKMELTKKHCQLPKQRALASTVNSINSKESAFQCRRPGFNPWIRKIPWRRKWQPTPVFLSGESHGQGSFGGLQSMGL